MNPMTHAFHDVGILVSAHGCTFHSSIAYTFAEHVNVYVHIHKAHLL